MFYYSTNISNTPTQPLYTKNSPIVIFTHITPATYLYSKYFRRFHKLNLVSLPHQLFPLPYHLLPLLPRFLFVFIKMGMYVNDRKVTLIDWKDRIFRTSLSSAFPPLYKWNLSMLFQNGAAFHYWDMIMGLLLSDPRISCRNVSNPLY